MLLPLQRERKVIEDYTDNFYELVKLHSQDEGIDRSLQYNIRQVYDQRLGAAAPNIVMNLEDTGYPIKWRHPEFALKVLKELPFLRRIPEDVML